MTPYANAFNEEANGNSWDPDDRSDFSSPWLWERKYELDSLCYPIQLAWLLHTNTGRVSQFDSVFVAAVGRILDTLEAELDHANNSPYFFIRNTTLSTERIGDDGNGSPVAVTGMVWQGFRSSDDACVYHYVIPANMFAVVAMDYLERIFSQILDNPTIAARARALRESIDRGIREYGVINNRAGERIFAYEVDGLGHSLLMDDGNGPSLLAAPYLGYCKADDPVYAATRRTLLSTENPYYYEGRYSKGIAPPHTPPRYVWPIALSMQGLTSASQEEKAELLDNMVSIDAGTHLMHEGIDADDPAQFTRPWFSWSNMMFCELVMDYFGIRIKQ